MLSDGSFPRAAAILGTALMLVLARPSPARPAQDARDQARAEVVRGVELLGKRDFARALKHFEAALSLYPSPKIHYNVALAHQGLGNPEQAIAAFRRFLQETPDPPPEHKAHARAQLAALEKEAGRPGQSPASRPPSTEAEALVRQGVELRKQRKHLEAYDYFRRAHEMSATPRTAAQLGLVEYQLGRWVDAESHLDQAVKARDPWIDQNRKTIESALETVRSHVAYIEIKGTPAGAEVIVNDRRVGTLPLPGLIRAGEGYAEVHVTAPGHVPAHRTLTVTAQLTQQLFVSLQPQGAGAVAGASRGGSMAPAGPGAPPADGLTGRRGPVAGASGEAPGRTARVAGLALGAVGLGALGYGAFQSYRVHSLSEKTARSDTQGIARGREAQRQQWWGYGAGAVALGAAGLLWWLGQPGAAGDVTLAIDPGTRSFFLGLRL
jgi:Tfp pilus assembly protein PilF